MSHAAMFNNSTIPPNVTDFSQPQLGFYKVLVSNFWAISVLNTIFNIVAIVIDISALCGIIKANNFSEGTRVFLANMTILDLIMAMTLQPSLTAYLLLWIGASTPQWLFDVFNALYYVLWIASFLSFLVVSLDRYLLIFYPFVYTNTMTTTKAIIVCCLFNLQAVVSFLILRFTAPPDTEQQYLNIIMYIIVVLLIIIHARIMLTARQMHKRIRQNSASNVQQTTLSRRRVEIKQAGVTFGLFITVIVCFTPLIIVQSIKYFASNLNPYTSAVALYWSVFIMLVCPILKQLLLCVLNSAIRAAIQKLFCGTQLPEVNLALRSMKNTNNLDLNHQDAME